MLRMIISALTFFPCFFMLICFVGVPFYFMMEFFNDFFAKKFTSLNKKVMGILSFAVSALIYSLGFELLFATCIVTSMTSAEFILNPLLLFFMLSLPVLLGLVISIPFYSMMWFFIRNFEKRFPNECNEPIYSEKKHSISFIMTAVIFHCIPYKHYTKTLPKQSNDLTDSEKKFFISFKRTAVIFSCIFSSYLSWLAYDEYKSRSSVCCTEQ
jgi:hypothetical protein